MKCVESAGLRGVLELTPKTFSDERGNFTKYFQMTQFAGLGLCGDFKEDFVSLSKQGVLRGMHFQIAPHDQHKLVYCVSGSVLDVVLDVNPASPTFGNFESFELSAAKGNSLYIPKGYAHGFCVLGSHDAVMSYKVSEEYSADHDLGVRWDSFGMKWPSGAATISARDKAFPSLSELKSRLRFS
jgi:dTDP-4-dehydrorhamnose 3,5-epimerase